VGCDAAAHSLSVVTDISETTVTLNTYCNFLAHTSHKRIITRITALFFRCYSSTTSNIKLECQYNLCLSERLRWQNDILRCKSSADWTGNSCTDQHARHISPILNAFCGRTLSEQHFRQLLSGLFFGYGHYLSNVSTGFPRFRTNSGATLARNLMLEERWDQGTCWCLGAIHRTANHNLCAANLLSL
jgi:hypothetical protein